MSNKKVEPYLANTPTGLPIATPPKQTRSEIKHTLVRSLKMFAYYGLSEGVSGHISVTDPSYQDCFWVNPFGIPFNVITENDLICVNNKGVVIDGKKEGKVNPSSFTIHNQLHANGYHAVAHSHAQNARSLGALGKTLLPINQEAAAFHEQNSIFYPYDGPAISTEHGISVAAAMSGNIALNLRFHGLLTIGQNLQEAIFRHVSFETCAGIQLKAMAAGDIQIMNEEQAVSAREGFNEADFNRFSFEMIAKEIGL